MTDNEEADIAMLALVLQQLDTESSVAVNEFESILAEHIREQRRLNACLPAEKVRVTWTPFKDKLSETHFRRMFCISGEAFDILCNTLCRIVGEEVFQWEDPCAQACNRTVPPIVG
jgi:hypothetical protein